MADYILQCVWPITDDSHTMRALIAEAVDQLDTLADQSHCIITGPPLWDIQPAADVPGWTGYAPGNVLIARMPAERYGPVTEHRHLGSIPDPAAIERLISGNRPAVVRQVDQRHAILAMARNAEIAAVASRFGITVSAVEQVIDRDRRRQKAPVPA